MQFQKVRRWSVVDNFRIPLLLQIEGEPRLTIEEDGRIIHKGVVIGQDKELADMLMGKVSIEEHADIPDRGEQPSA